MGQVFANQFQLFIYFDGLHGVSIGGSPQRGPHDTNGARRKPIGGTGILMASVSQIVNKSWGVKKCLNKKRLRMQKTRIAFSHTCRVEFR